MNKIIILAGPTAVGKTDLSISLAKALDTEIISADSVQIYKKLDIGSAKPTLEEMAGVPHHLIDHVSPFDRYSVSEYAEDAKKVISALHKKGKIPLIVGGTGLYINALMYDMDFGEALEDLAYREKMTKLANEKGNEYIHNMLKDVDPQAADRIHANNLKRVIRALEINHVSGQKTGDFANQNTLTKDYEIYLFGLTRSREKLYARINQRVDIMMTLGLVQEVEALKNLGLNDSNQSMQGIGYKEVLGYLNHLYDYDTMVSLLKQSSRRYAKRQMTWFKRYPHLMPIDLEVNTRHEDIVRIILQKINIENEEEVQ